MKNYVEINLDIKHVKVDAEQGIFPLNISVDLIQNPPENKSDIYEIIWDATLNYNPSSKGTLMYKNGGGAIFFDESKYADWVQPYVDVWQAEKDRLEQEQAQAQEEYAKFENRKERALTQITNDYHSVLERGFVRTSLGFDADISPESVATLLGTQTGLVYAMNTLVEGIPTPKTAFRDFCGLKHELDAMQVERLVYEINSAQNHIREMKYTFKTQVKETYDNDSLNAVIENCIYSTLDFTNGQPVELPFVQPQSIKERIDRWM